MSLPFSVARRQEQFPTWFRHIYVISGLGLASSQYTMSKPSHQDWENWSLAEYIVSKNNKTSHASGFARHLIHTGFAFSHFELSLHCMQGQMSLRRLNGGSATNVFQIRRPWSCHATSILETFLLSPRCWPRSLKGTGVWTGGTRSQMIFINFSWPCLAETREIECQHCFGEYYALS